MENDINKKDDEKWNLTKDEKIGLVKLILLVICVLLVITTLIIAIVGGDAILAIVGIGTFLYLVYIVIQGICS